MTSPIITGATADSVSIGHTAAPYGHIVMDDGLAHEIGAPVRAMPTARSGGLRPEPISVVSALRAPAAIAKEAR